jgi:polyhydroxyalkanoate synthesis regulator phasin
VERRTKLKVVVAAVAGFVVAVALGAAGALGAAAVLSDDGETRLVNEDVRIEPDDPADSLTKAFEFLVDEAVEAGRLTEEEGQRLKERLDESGFPSVLPDRGKLPFGDPNFDFFDLPGFGVFGAAVDLDAAASYLGLSSSELHEELADGKSLAEIAREQDKSVDGLVQELVEVAEERIDEAVADGRLSEERATRLRQGLEDRIRDRVDDEWRLRGFPFKFDFEFDPGFESPRGFRG